ncbi:Putative alpha-1,2-glucosyltransferase ALG10-B [Cricetulus griseus]|uniref:Dol-P-Glc:Glc(2)Man(9)GlcNAc(2)-PP-Dol alpha-1,2-glucosyltransferase n=1 Tax=Cricetulus griseus TaxID=10029 RepID=G3IA25_CRIGR|nr:Putative alpha-1,2-glucosyltransferase ALG10-B [Cricetulus griseus]
MAQLEGYYFSAALSCTFLVSCLLFSAFSRALREPYMDEIFHLPQAQRYCEGRFSLSQTQNLKGTGQWLTLPTLQISDIFVR